MPDPRYSTNSRSLKIRISSLFRGTETPLKNSSSFIPSVSEPAEVISILLSKISNFGGISRVKSLCTKALIIASLSAIGFHSHFSILSLYVILA